jgi:hypothetical protein
MAFGGYVLKNWDTALLVALVLYGVVSGLEVIDDESLNLIADTTNTTIPEKIGHFAIWSITFNSLNPAYRYELPFTDKYIVPLNDIPFFDATDIPFIVLMFIIANWFLTKAILHRNYIVNKIYKILILILVVVISFLIWKTLIYYAYLWSSAKIGMGVEQAIATREAFLANIKDLSLPLLILSGFGGLAIYKKVKERM